MFYGLMTEMVAREEQAYRQKVVYPAAARRAQLDHELRALRAAGEERVARRGIGQRLGTALARLAARLGGPTRAPAR